MRALHFILSHSIFIACCAVGLCFQTNVLLHIPHNITLYGFIFFSTLCSYNFYWLLSKYYFSDGKVSLLFIKKQFTFFLIFILAAIATCYFVIQLPWLLPFISLGLIFTLLYSLPLWPFSFTKKFQHVGFFKTILLALTWAYVTTFLPVLDVYDTNFMLRFYVLLLFATRFFFMLLLCIIFDTRDISIDKINGLHSLATDVSMKKLRVIIAVVYFLHMLSALLFCFYYAHTTQAFAFISIGIIFWVLYAQSLKNKSYIFYYFLIDGLMLLSAGASYLAVLYARIIY
jgi:4-hydroxybenzoate polyprenyltransferase